jgi:hypothetical protein
MHECSLHFTLRYLYLRVVLSLNYSGILLLNERALREPLVFICRNHKQLNSVYRALRMSPAYQFSTLINLPCFLFFPSFIFSDSQFLWEFLYFATTQMLYSICLNIKTRGNPMACMNAAFTSHWDICICVWFSVLITLGYYYWTREPLESPWFLFAETISSFTLSSGVWGCPQPINFQL